MANRIFAITPGRSGMHYVKALCKHCTNLPDTATPEYFPEPKNYEEYLDTPNTHNEKYQIASKAWNKMPDIFFSTSGLTKNGYLMHLANLGARFVSLRRNTIDNAHSWYLMNGAPGESGRGVAYHPSIESKYNCLQVPNAKSLTSFQKCLWLVIETKARAQHIADLGADVYFADLEDLNFECEVERLFEWMLIDFDLSNINKVLGQHINPMTDGSRDLRENTDLDGYEMYQQLKQLNKLIETSKGEVRI